MGIDIVFYDASITGKKEGQGANGYYDSDTDTIYLDLQNAKDDAKTIAYTLSHELVHFIKKWSPEKYNEFAEFLIEQYLEHGISSASLLREKMTELDTDEVDYAFEEMICDACETMLLDSNAAVKLMELRKNDLELFEKIKLHVLKILNAIREAYKSLGYQPSSYEAKALLSMKDSLEKFYSMFEEAAVDATQNYQSLGTEGYNESVAKDSSEHIKKQAKKNSNYFVEDKFFRTQMQKWDSLVHGSYVKIGKIEGDHPLVRVGMPQGIIKYDVDKLNRNMVDHTYLTTELLKAIPDIIADPIAISEYSAENTVSVFGNIFVGNSPMMVGVTISKDRSSTNISKVRTYNARRDVGTLITDDTVLYMNEDKKRTLQWFQACGIQVPLGGTKFGFIRSISQKASSVKQQKKKTSDKDYLDAIENGDMESAQSMVDEAAKETDSKHIKKQTKKTKTEQVDDYLNEEYLEPITVQDVDILRSIGRKSIAEFTAEDIKKSQKWALKFYEEFGIKSPFFRAWFGDWRAHQKSDIVRIVGQKATNYSTGKVRNKDIDVDISWGRELKGETINHLVRDKVSQYALNDVYSIIENAVYFDTVVSMPTSNSKMPNTAFMHSFYSLYRTTEGKIQLLKIYVEEALSNNQQSIFKRGYQLKDITKVADLPNSVLSQEGGLTDGKSTTTYSISDLYQFVKNFDKDFTPAPEVSKHMLNADGTPKVFYHGTRKENGGFWEFDYNKAKKKGGLGFKSLGAGNYFTSNKLDGTELYGSRVIDAYLSIKKPLVVKRGSEFKNEVSRAININATQMTYPRIQQEMRDAGYDGVVLLNENSEVAIAVTFDSEQIKSATDNIGTFDKNNPDIRYQKKKASNREILASTLEGAIDSSTPEGEIALKKLKEYREKIELIEKEEAHLAEIKAEIKKISFTKGADRSKLKELNDEKIKTANRISIYDRQLLRLEAMKPITDLLTREKEKARKAAEKKGREAMARYRERANKTEMRHKIKDVVNELNKYLTKGTKEKHVPIELQKAVAEALDAVNMDMLG